MNEMSENEFEQLAVALRPRIMQSLSRMQLAAADAEDVAQDVMVRLWQMRGDLREVRSPEGLAVTMAHRLALNLLRRKPMESVDARPTAMAVMASQASDPSVRLEERDNEKWLEARLKQLPATWHTILYMRQVERRSSKEIASLLGIKETSVRTLLAKARRTLLEAIRKRETV